MAPAIAVALATTLCAWSNRNGVTVQRVELTSAVAAMARVWNGAGAVDMALNYSRGQIAEATAWQALSASADADAAYPVDLPTAP